MASNATAELNLARIGEEIDILLTEIYGEYVAEGSPTKLGGLRFLDVPSAKTFAFEKSKIYDDGNLLVISAPAVGEEKTLTKQIKSGPHSKALDEVVVRKSSDAGKGNKSFVEVTYKLPTTKWLTNDAIQKAAEKEQCNGNEAVTVVLKHEVLPVAREVMAHFIQVIRENTKDAAII
ncbi:MAG: hypothetical protein WC314_12170 [Vulcanimicrobiota bacterium]